MSMCGSTHSQIVCMDVWCVSVSVCVWRAVRAHVHLCALVFTSFLHVPVIIVCFCVFTVYVSLNTELTYVHWEKLTHSA